MTFRYVSKCSKHERSSQEVASRWTVEVGAVPKAFVVIYAAASHCEALTEGSLADKSTDQPGLFTHAESFKRAREGLTPVCTRARGWHGHPALAGETAFRLKQKMLALMENT